MKRLFLLILTLVGLGAICGAQSSSTNGLYIDDVTVIDATGAPPQPHRGVMVRDGRIVGIVPGEELGKASEKLAGTWVDGRGKFLIPGLWDMHVHMVFGDWFPRGKEITLPLFIANGITGVRDMGGELDVLEQWRKEITAGTLLGPRMVISGPMLDGPQPRFPSSVAIKTPETGNYVCGPRAGCGARVRGVERGAEEL
jgi:imidazolonepropionase-like amidohydrolase